MLAAPAAVAAKVAARIKEISFRYGYASNLFFIARNDPNYFIAGIYLSYHFLSMLNQAVQNTFLVDAFPKLVQYRQYQWVKNLGPSRACQKNAKVGQPCPAFADTIYLCYGVLIR
jgi:hypothetical protein